MSGRTPLLFLRAIVKGMASNSVQQITISLSDKEYSELWQRANSHGMQAPDVATVLVRRFLAQPSFDVTEQDIDLSSIFRSISREELHNMSEGERQRQVDGYLKLREVMLQDEDFQGLTMEEIDVACKDARRVVSERRRALREKHLKEQSQVHSSSIF